MGIGFICHAGQRNVDMWAECTVLTVLGNRSAIQSVNLLAGLRMKKGGLEGEKRELVATANFHMNCYKGGEEARVLHQFSHLLNTRKS